MINGTTQWHKGENTMLLPKLVLASCQNPNHTRNRKQLEHQSQVWESAKELGGSFWWFLGEIVRIKVNIEERCGIEGEIVPGLRQGRRRENAGRTHVFKDIRDVDINNKRSC